MLSRAHRFHGLGSLTFAYRQGQTVRGSLLGLKYAVNPRRKTHRAAVVVSRKVDKSAVARNRMRRRVYEALRQLEPGISGPYDLIFTVFNESVATIEFAELEGQVATLLKKAGITGNGGASHDIVSTEGKQS